MKKLSDVFKSMNSKQKLILKVVLIFFVICILLVVVIGIFKNRKLTYTQIEDKLISSAEKYYSEKEELLPKSEGGSVTIDSLTLIENKYLKELTKYNKNADSCSATVRVVNNNGNYLYLPSLKCSDYSTTTLYDEILKNETIVEEGTGLYLMNDEYVYRGEYPNNYVKFADKTWRILSINNDKEIRLIQVDSFQDTPWDNRYNVNSNYSSGITKYEISRIKDKLNTLYESAFDARSKSLISSKQLCIGSRNRKETDNSGKVECSKLTEDYYPVGMIQVNEFIRVSIDSNCKFQTNSSCTNYNYLTKLESDFWTITPSVDNDYEVYYVGGVIVTGIASDFVPVRLTLNLTDGIRYESGNGTVDNPYIVS